MRKEEKKEKQGEIPIKPKKRRNNEEKREKIRKTKEKYR